MHKKMGRPVKPAEDQRSVIVPVRMTAAERQACERAAAKAKLKLSAWIRAQAGKAAKKAGGD